MHQKQWRLIPPIEASGFQQMAIDEWLLEQHRLDKGPPCLRFYTWNPIAISLGFHQYQYPDLWKRLQWQGMAVELVRRPTGGRAVLHQGDLTYSLVVSGLGGQRRTVYNTLCQFLIAGWRTLGIPLHLGADVHARSANCFESATAADLVLGNGYKLIGSAQLYRDRCVLQHGSMRLAPDPDLVAAVFGTQITPPAELNNINAAAVRAALVDAAKTVFGVDLTSQPLSFQEREKALRWAKAKHKR